MNTRASVAYGWGVLIAAGGGAYYFAKRSINADRKERADAEERRRQAQHRLQYGAPPPAAAGAGERRATGTAGQKGDRGASPGHDAHAGDVSPAASRGAAAPASEESKYEARRPFRSPKGDRFS